MNKAFPSSRFSGVFPVFPGSRLTRAREGVNRENVGTFPKNRERTILPPPRPVTLLKHCRCIDCRHFHRVAGEYYCTQYVGGTKVVWATGERSCDPAPDVWHYCAFYYGPQISKDIWAWPKATHQAAQVGAGSNISGGVEPVANPAAGDEVRL